jgi:hypothetical protein
MPAGLAAVTDGTDFGLRWLLSHFFSRFLKVKNYGSKQSVGALSFGSDLIACSICSCSCGQLRLAAQEALANSAL